MINCSFDGGGFNGSVSMYGYTLDSKQWYAVTNVNLTNNTAEYKALYELLVALNQLIESGEEPCEILIQGDSQVVINQLTKAWRVNYPHLQELNKKIKFMIELIQGKGFGITIEWVRRGENPAGLLLEKVKK